MTPIIITSPSGTLPLGYLMDVARGMLRMCENGQELHVIVTSKKLTLTVTLKRVSAFEITETFDGKLNKLAAEEACWPDCEAGN